jgi:hypothetical protein
LTVSRFRVTTASRNATASVRRWHEGRVMKYLKALGSVVFAALASLAIIAAGSAQATTLCKTTVGTCPSAWRYPTSTEIRGSLDSKSLVLELAGFDENTCLGSWVEGSTTNAGSSTETVAVTVLELAIGLCTGAEPAVLKTGALEIHADGDTGAGVLTSKGLEITTLSFGFMTCVWKTGTGVNLGTIDEPASSTRDATITINATLPVSGPGCPTSGKLTAEYLMTSPTPFYVSTG